MMFHDVGKGHGHDHSGRGARMMRTIAGRLGLNEDEAAACEFLVQHHLLMSHLAQRRDVHDDELVIEFCQVVGSVENLQRLYVLTYADMRAVGPGVWTNWRDSLLGELYARAREFFEKGAFEAEDRAARAERIRVRVAAEATPAERGRLERFFAALPDTYFLSTPEDMVAAHGELRWRFDERESAGDRPAIATQLAHFPERDYTEFAVCTRDRPGLFAMLSGVLAAHGMNILAARITTTVDDVALDAFRISHEEGDAALEEERWERVERTLRAVLRGEADVEELVRRSRRPSILTRRRRPVPTNVEIDNRVSREYTVLDVYTRDRVGLLFTITNCLYHLWLEIHLAKITTMVDQVLDVFYVTDHEGRKIEDPARLDVIRRELIRALESEVEEDEARVAGG
jgi:[protein-PII] uridylyltransferase